MKLHTISVYAPRWTGRATADTISLTVNGSRVKNSKHPRLFDALANLINAGNDDDATITATVRSHLGYEF